MGKNQIALNIHLVEDDQVTATLIKNTFSRNKNNSFNAYKSAEDYLRNRKTVPDVIIIDNDLGVGMNGLELTKQLQSKNNKTQIIFYSAGNSDIEKVALKNGVFEFITKGEEQSLFFLKNAIKHVRKIKREEIDKKNSKLFISFLILVLLIILTVAFTLGS